MISPELNMSDYGDEDPANRLERLGLPLLLLNRALIEARGAVLEPHFFGCAECFGNGGVFSSQPMSW